MQRVTLLVGLIVVGVVGAAHGNQATMLERVEALELPEIEGEVAVHHSDGYEDRARSLQAMAAAAASYFGQTDVLDVTLDLTLAVLDQEDWARIEDRPYGVPVVWHLPGEPKVVFLPATPDSPITSLLVGLRGRLSEATLARFEEIGVPFEDAAPRFADLLGLHEIGHAYAGVYMTRFSQRWLNEFVASFLAYAFMSERMPERARLWDAVNDAVVEASEHEHTSLADFDRLYIGVGLPNYGWFQGRFQQRGADVFRESGLAFIHALRASWIETPEPPTEDPLRLQQLEEIHPGFRAWATGFTGDLE